MSALPVCRASDYTTWTLILQCVLREKIGMVAVCVGGDRGLVCSAGKCWTGLEICRATLATVTCLVSGLHPGLATIDAQPGIQLEC